MSLNPDIPPAPFRSFWNKKTRGTRLPDTEEELHDFAWRFYNEGFNRAKHEIRDFTNELLTPVTSKEYNA
jgi:hypothetical protein